MVIGSCNVGAKTGVFFFSKSLRYSFWGSGSAERKKQWKMARMIMNEKKIGTIKRA
jgi:hypothetical protein